MVFVWIVIAVVGVTGLWLIFGERIKTRRGILSPRLAGVEWLAATFAVAATVIGLTLAVLVSIDNLTVRTVNCVEVFDPGTGGDVLSCQQAGGLEWLPTWITGGTHRVSE